jgi:outer membrane protein TolC
LELSYVQPLLGRAGKAYNESRIVLAQLDADVARHQLCEDLQEHLFQVTEAYWELYRARVLRLQKQKLYDQAEAILSLLEARAEVDAVRQQILRARAAVASRRSDILRTQAAVRNAESRLRLLVNDPRLIDGGRLELVPAEWPLPYYVPVSMRESLQTAVRSRPDVAGAMREIKAAGVRLGIAKNELLPKLDLILSTYVAGLEGDADVGTALGNQFSVGEPGYSLGLLFEVPLGNRTARAEFDRRQAELQRAMMVFRATVEAGLTEVELAVREVETAYQEMVSKYQAMVAADAEERYLDERWRLLPGDDGNTPNLLEDLLDAQDRLAGEEAAFVTAQVNHTLALTALKRATGTLMRFTGGCQP